MTKNAFHRIGVAENSEDEKHEVRVPRPAEGFHRRGVTKINRKETKKERKKETIFCRMSVSYESVDKKQRTKQRTKTEDEIESAFRARVLTENKLDVHTAHVKQGTVSEQELSQVWRRGVTERRDGKYWRRKRGPYSEMLSGKIPLLINVLKIIRK